MEQEKIDELLQIIADALVVFRTATVENPGEAGEAVKQIREWMNFNAPEYWNYTKERNI
jgi:hypothetical protein